MTDSYYQPVQPPTYPVTCDECSVEYGPGSTVESHRQGSDTCLKSQIQRLSKVCQDLGADIHKLHQQNLKTIQNYENWVKSRSIRLNTKRIKAWVESVLGKELFTNRWERAMRVLEEAIEFAQAEGLAPSEIDKVMHRAYKRPCGNPRQEAAGIYVCLLAWSSSVEIDIEDALAEEIDRIEKQDREKIRAKQLEKFTAHTGIAPT